MITLLGINYVLYAFVDVLISEHNYTCSTMSELFYNCNQANLISFKEQVICIRVSTYVTLCVLNMLCLVCAVACVYSYKTVQYHPDNFQNTKLNIIIALPVSVSN